MPEVDLRTCPRGSTQGAGHQGCSNTGPCDETFRAVLAETGWEALDVFADALTGLLWAALSLTWKNASKDCTRDPSCKNCQREH